MVRTYKKCFPKFLNSGVAPAKFPYFIELKQVFAESAKKAAEWALDEQDEQVNATAEVFADINQEEYILDEKSEVELAEISIPVTKNFWNTLEATSLIKLVKAQQPNKINWSQISRSLRRKSILRTPVECRKKFSNIIRTYLITKAKRKLNASANIHFKYFDLMQETFGDQLPVFHRNFDQFKHFEF